MDWVDMVERERENHEEMLERISNIVVCTCDICGEELHHSEGAYACHKDDVCICENCYIEETEKERDKDSVCCVCGKPYWIDKPDGAEGWCMVEAYGELYCENCFEPVELCAHEDEINSIKYHINYDED